MRRKLTSRRALVVIVGLLFALAWAVPSIGASASKLARTALGRANQAVYDSSIAVNSSNNAKSTASAASSAAAAANSLANTANNTANSALNLANGATHITDNFTATVDPSGIGADSCQISSVAQLGVLSTDQVIVTPPDTQPAGIITQAMTSTNAVKLEFCNVTGGSIDPPSGSYEFSIIH